MARRHKRNEAETRFESPRRSGEGQHHRERNHQGIDNRLIDRGDDRLGRTGPIEGHERIGGMLRYYDRAA